jgi:hypothetical protein
MPHGIELPDERDEIVGPDWAGFKASLTVSIASRFLGDPKAYLDGLGGEGNGKIGLTGE